jgi:hypothetical protein
MWASNLEGFWTRTQITISLYSDLYYDTDNSEHKLISKYLREKLDLMLTFMNLQNKKHKYEKQYKILDNYSEMFCWALHTGSFIKNEPISKRYFAVRKKRRGKSRMPLQRA